jgi:tetratricopeptide (TPR) repeat protein
MKKLIYILFFFIAGIAMQAIAQQSKIDSLLILLKTDKEDTNKVNHLYQLSNKAVDDKDIVKYAEQSLLLAKNLNYKKGIAHATNNMGLIYNREGQIKEALDYYYHALKIDEEINDKEGISYLLNNIGSIHYRQRQIKEALDYYNRALKIEEELNDKRGIAISFNNIGLIYQTKNQIKEALDYYDHALKIEEEINDKEGIATLLANIGNIYYNQGQIKETLDYYHPALKILEEINDKEGIATLLTKIGEVYFKQKEYGLALTYSDSSLKFSQVIGFPQGILNAAQLLYRIYTEQKQWKLALKMRELCVSIHDSISNAETKKQKIITTKTEGIRFDFSIVHVNKNTIEVKASLFNDNSDTAYFFSSTCGGEIYSLRYDTAQFERPYYGEFGLIITCGGSMPIIIKITPKGQHDFYFWVVFKNIGNENKIKLGFDFYSVNKSFDLTTIKNSNNIYKRPKKEQTIIWADEKILK